MSEGELSPIDYSPTHTRWYVLRRHRGPVRVEVATTRTNQMREGSNQFKGREAQTKNTKICQQPCNSPLSAKRRGNEQCELRTASNACTGGRQRDSVSRAKSAPVAACPIEFEGLSSGPGIACGIARALDSVWSHVEQSPVQDGQCRSANNEFSEIPGSVNLLAQANCNAHSRLD